MWGGSGADSRRLGCGAALYFGLLTVSLTECLASLAFFTTPEDNKELKACRDSISVWLSLSLLIQQSMMIRESLDRNNDGISLSASPPPSQGGFGVNVLEACAHFAPAARGKLGLEVQLWKKNSKEW